MPVHRHPVASSRGSESLERLPLDRALIGRLRESFATIRQHGNRLGETFYSRLFAAAPHLRAMFRTDLASQTDKLMASLDAIVTNLAAPEQNAAMLAALGKRHAGYGARPEHYGLVIDLLVESIRETLGEHADDRTLADWRIALRLVSDQMIAAAESDDPPTRT